jgi:hypothetical protein
MNEPLTRTTELAFVEEIAGTLVDAVMAPTTWTTPVLAFKIPLPDPVVASTLPTTMIVPEALFLTAAEFAPLTLPVTFTIPPLLLFIAAEFAPDDPVAEPVTLTVPLDKLFIP